MKKILLLLLISISLIACKNDKGLPSKEKEGALSDTIQKNIVDHSDFTVLLKKYVDEKGYVDYPSFQNDSLTLNAYLEKLATNPPQDSWPIEEQLAYYINIYNAATVQLIIRNNMPGSIKDIAEDGGPWEIKFVKIGDKTVSLSTIEKGILQPMKEPRMHFAINCASESCPKLQQEAFTAENMEEMLTRSTKEFLNGPKNEISEKEPKISSIFEFYPADFKVDGKTITEFINEYSDVKINKDAKIMYLDYDWSLNNQKSIPK